MFCHNTLAVSWQFAENSSTS